ncbi:amino acid transporter [Patellaria atrata CBS 101060]|uniref:Amino acid transporter n=1 Tax=Patellaria atrata CBS 101060 TaxID=1346257 RepID=A0A9P4S8X5_9PEZI|nr:amino acid transporter [Patellaria atrata CBS 101060]
MVRGEDHEMMVTDKSADVTVQQYPSSEEGHNGSKKEGSREFEAYGHIESQTRVRRLFNFIQLFAFSLTFMSSWEGMCTNLWFAMYNGGPRTFAWSIFIVYFGACAQSASLAEMASLQPIAGAQYHWTHHLAPPQAKRFITWIQGWVTWFGWVSLLAGGCNMTAIITQQLIILNNPDYVPERWHITLIMIAILILQGFVNIYVFFIIPWLELVGGIAHVCLYVVFVVVLVTLGPRHSADFIFFEKNVSSGWNNSFLSFNVGLLTGIWSFTGFDGTLHMSEETRKAKQAVPRATFWTIAVNGLLAYSMTIIILMTMGTIEDALTANFPMVPILLGVTGSKKATTALVTGLWLISFCVNLASIASVSRLTWAWARDGGLPKYFSIVSSQHLVPERAIVLCIFLTCIISLLNIGNTAAFSAITALCSLALYVSYFIAIACMLHARYRKQPGLLGGWNLGGYGAYVNAFALLYTTWSIIFLPFPTTLPVDAENMNYAGPIFGMVIIFTITYWFVWARKNWEGINPDIVKYIISQE